MFKAQWNFFPYELLSVVESCFCPKDSKLRSLSVILTDNYYFFSLFQLKHLEILDLAYNRLSWVEVSQLFLSETVVS